MFSSLIITYNIERFHPWISQAQQHMSGLEDPALEKQPIMAMWN